MTEFKVQKKLVVN